MDQAASRSYEAELIRLCRKMPVASMKAPSKCGCASLENMEICDVYLDHSQPPPYASLVTV